MYEWNIWNEVLKKYENIEKSILFIQNVKVKLSKDTLLWTKLSSSKTFNMK